MATRLYPAHDFPIGLSPAYSSSWDVTSGAARYRLDTALEANSSVNSLTNVKGAIAGPVNVLVAQFCLPGLAAQTIDGTLKGQFRFSESSVSADASVQTVVRVWDPYTQSFRGTLLAAHSAATNGSAGTQGYEISTTITNRKIPSGWSGSGDTLSSVVASLGDWLVVEIGARVGEVAATTRTITLSATQTPGNSDLSEDETTTTTSLNTWLEFSDTLTFHPVVRGWQGNSASHFGLRYLPVFGAPGGGGAPVPTTGQIWPRGMGA
jgi:hypothetical protein